MGKSTGTEQPTDDQLLLLKEQQSAVREGSPNWHFYQEQINQIVADRFLHYVNR